MVSCGYGCGYVVSEVMVTATVSYCCDHEYGKITAMAMILLLR